MKKLLLVSVIGLSGLFVVANASIAAAHHAAAASHAKATYEVKKVTCSSCVSHIKKELAKLDGVNSVSVNIEARRVVVSFDSAKISSEKIRKNIEGLGYAAKKV